MRHRWIGVLIAVLPVLLVSKTARGPQTQTETAAYAQIGYMRALGESHTLDLEAGYIRHLEWHRRAKDPFNWYSCSVLASKERQRWMIYATFGHTAAELNNLEFNGKPMPSLQSICENLARAEKQFLAATEAVPADQWKSCPAEGRWSAGELVCHLIQVERAIIKNAGKVLQRPPQPRPLSKRFHFPMALVESPIIPRKTPIPLDPALVCEKEQMLAQLREVRWQTRVFMDEQTKEKDLRKYHMPHPFLGTFNLCEWFQVIASHQVRHSKQMREIAAALPKTVATPQK